MPTLSRTNSKQQPFAGSATSLNDKDYERAAARLCCDVAAIRAVAEVESGGRSGFLPDKRPRILFESRWFHKLTNGKHDTSHPDISTPAWIRNYAGGAAEYDRLARAIGLDRTAALKSASWGKFQVLGVNHRVCGWDDVESFVTSMTEGEGRQLDAFVGFVVTNGLADELRDRRWDDFARGYNGPGYRRNRYAERMAEAYARHAGGVVRPDVAAIQRALNAHGADLVVDGVTGARTRAAIRIFQREAGLAVDGIAGPRTLAALGLSGTQHTVEPARPERRPKPSVERRAGAARLGGRYWT